MLKTLSDAYRTAFVCVNQVTDRTASECAYLPDVILPRGQRLGATPVRAAAFVRGGRGERH